jgi:DNA-binding ferritin-like protein
MSDPTTLPLYVKIKRHYWRVEKGDLFCDGHAMVRKHFSSCSAKSDVQTWRIIEWSLL